MATNGLDPYEISALCGHKSLRGDARAPGFAVWLGADPPAEEPEPIPFSGEVYQEISWEGIDSDGHQTAQLQIVRFHMSGEHPQFGWLSISLDTTRPGVVASLRAVQPGQKFPVVHTTRLHVTATAPALPDVLLQDQGPPLEFVSEPSPVWPPEDTIYRLAVPVHFEDRANPGPVAVTASSGAVLVGGHQATS
jgi:hypothetical protein